MDPENLSVIFGLVLVVVISFTFLVWRQRERYLNELKLRSDIEDEEKRLFGFLRGLGHAIEDDLSANRLNQVIVRGLVDVLGASGGALYLLDDDRKQLIPSFLSKDCPSLIGLSDDLLEKSKEDPRVLKSVLRLTRVDATGGLFGKTLTLGEPIWIPDAFSDVSLAGEDGGNPGTVDAMLAPLSHGGTVIGVLVAANHQSQPVFSDNDFEVFKSISEQTAFALGNALAHHEAAAKRQLDREIRAASEVQRILLPERAPDFNGYRVEGRNLPARVISGDYFDYIPIGGGKMAIVIADVSGKGVPAGIMMAMCRSVLRSTSSENLGPAEWLARVNRQLFPDIREDMFISMAMLIIDESSSKVTLVRAGHDAPMLFTKSTNEVKELKPRGLAVGIDDGDVFERSVEELEFEMKSGDCLLLYTDGIPEAEDSSGFEFGKQETIDAFKEGAARGSLSALDLIESRVLEFANKQAQTDDMTLVGIEKR